MASSSNPVTKTLVDVLPYEILLSIMDHLDLHHQICLALTSKQLNLFILGIHDTPFLNKARSNFTWHCARSGLPFFQDKLMGQLQPWFPKTYALCKGCLESYYELELAVKIEQRCAYGKNDEEADKNYALACRERHGVAFKRRQVTLQLNLSRAGGKPGNMDLLVGCGQT